MIEIAAKEVVFHFNKKHLEDDSIPPWVLKCSGKSWYVSHVTCELPWSTKETPLNAATKGAIKVKRALVQIDDDNHAVLKPLTPEDEHRVKGNSDQAQIIGWQHPEINNHLDHIRHSEIQYVSSGGCSAPWYVCEIYSEEDWAELQLQWYPRIRKFMPNEWQFKDYQSGICDSLDDEE